MAVCFCFLFRRAKEHILNQLSDMLKIQGDKTSNIIIA